MATTTSEYTRSVADATEWEPFMAGGEAVGEVHWIRTEGAEGATLNVGLWRSEPQSFPYPFTADETIHALEGELVVDLVESGEQVVLRRGDIASFTKGTKSTWTVTEPFKKFFVISG
ncbi:cupin domain-containing protein [Actinomycetospora flava]|uniref:Cupin domain-containing protein n=1 Tax=Actinomycetospora flava TaxID=3129232 RepID=A0ABU8ME36_9PSEU